MTGARILFIIAAVFSAVFSDARQVMNLAGEWRFGLSDADIASTVMLPGTMDTNGKGNRNNDSGMTTQLSREFSYEGPAYYVRDVVIPKNWKNSDITLFLERTRPTSVWVDGEPVGSQKYLSAPHKYDLTSYLSPGKHTIMVMVNNSDSIPRQVRSNSHACTESTQSNWNGIVGRIELQAKPKRHIVSMRAYPDIDSRSFRVAVQLSDEAARKGGKLKVVSGNNSAEIKTKPGLAEYEVTLALGDTAKLWSDRMPALHLIKAMIPGVDTLSLNTGLRKFSKSGMQFAVNDTLVFLRGRHDACVFPLTGYAPMDVESWRQYFRTIKDYGLNHVRFHSWCPPEACFEAADIEGIYLQPELTIWGAFNRDEKTLMDFLMADGEAIHRDYGEHPSFVLFSLGNELGGDKELMREFSERFRAMDNRHYYALGSNSFLGWQGNMEGQDFSVTCRVGGGNGYDTHVRASFSFADADEGGYLNNTYPNTVMDFEKAVKLSDVPVIGHETGQFQIYPDYAEMAKYNGVMKPVNFGIFRQRLADAGMLDQARDFFNASGKWAVELYKADMEMNLRTPSMAGFQLLDIQDYPGQGTALVGILDAFMDSKGLVEPVEWRQSCAPVVALARFPAYCVVEGKPFDVSFEVANYGDRSLEGDAFNWSLRDGDRVVAEGTATVQGGFGLLPVDSVALSVPVEGMARQLSLDMEVPSAGVANSYKIWAYPSDVEIDYGNVYVASSLDEVLARLRDGGKVLLAPERQLVDSVTVGGLFQTDYWNYRMFRTICANAHRPVSPGTLGILADAAHPALASFPNEGHSDWQWYAVVKNSYPLILDRFNESGYIPLVQVIDNIERNHRLGLVAEFDVEGGKLLLMMVDKDKVMEYPEGRQFVKSVVEYMNTPSFKPSTGITSDDLKSLLTSPSEKSAIKDLHNISYD